MREYITIGIDKNGEADFGVNSSIEDLSLEKFREMMGILSTTIYIAEMMWRNKNEPRAYEVKENNLLT